MADKKETRLSIVIRTVDKATAPIRAISARIHALTSPIRAAGGKMMDVFRGVGSAVGGLLRSIPLIGGAIVATAGGAVAGLMALVDGFDELGDKAEAAGVRVDFLAQLRYAAKRSGASVEELDTGILNFSKSLGQARAGTGRMAGFISKVYPPLLKQLKATKSNEEAFLALSDAMKKLKDPAKRAALATATVGDASLAPLLARGSAGVRQLADRYAELAGSQEDAASKSGEVDDAMVDLKASADGFKAALVSGLAPALKVIVDRLRAWFVAHRGDVAKWAEDLGKKLPGAIRAVVDWVEKAIGKLGAFFSTLSNIYNKVQAFMHLEELQAENKRRDERIAFARKKIAANNDDMSSDEIKQKAILTVAQEDQFRARIKAQSEGVDWTKSGDTTRFGTTERTSVYSPEELRALTRTIGIGESAIALENVALINGAIAKAPQAQASNDVTAQARSAAAAPIVTESKAKVIIEMPNAPKGTRARTDPKSTADVDMNLGYQMGVTP